MKVERIKWRNIGVGLLGLTVMLVGVASADSLMLVKNDTQKFMGACMSSDSAGGIALGMILITLIAALKLLVQRNQ